MPGDDDDGKDHGVILKWLGPIRWTNPLSSTEPSGKAGADLCTAEVVGEVEDALVFAPPAERDECHPGIDKLAFGRSLSHVRSVPRAHGSLAPASRPLRPVLRINELAPETCLELIGVQSLREGEIEHVDVVAAEGMAARTE
jgi:hypothetical protein